MVDWKAERCHDVASQRQGRSRNRRRGAFGTKRKFQLCFVELVAPSATKPLKPEIKLEPTMGRLSSVVLIPRMLDFQGIEL